MADIMLDTDEITADFTSKFIEFHNEAYGTSIRLEDFTRYSYPKLLGCSREEARKKVEIFHSSSYFNDIMPVPGSTDAVRRLSSRYSFSVVTHRPEYLKNQTFDFYDRNFKSLIGDIYFARGCYNRSSLSKEEYISGNGTLYAIDDIFEIGLKIKERGVPVIILKKPWNQHKQPSDGILMKNDWKDIESYLLNQHI